jgi:hypothetical protein
MDQRHPIKAVTHPHISDDPERLRDLLMRSFRAAVAEALAENDRLGITSYGAENGIIVERKPKRQAPRAIPLIEQPWMWIVAGPNGAGNPRWRRSF